MNKNISSPTSAYILLALGLVCQSLWFIKFQESSDLSFISASKFIFIPYLAYATVIFLFRKKDAQSRVLFLFTLLNLFAVLFFLLRSSGDISANIFASFNFPIFIQLPSLAFVSLVLFLLRFETKK